MSESSANVDEEARGMTVTHDDGKQPQPKQSAAAAVTYVNDTDVLVMSASVEKAKNCLLPSVQELCTHGKANVVHIMQNDV